MSKFLDSKMQLIHITSEIVVLGGLTFYFSQKNRQLMSHIEGLATRLEEQEDLIQKHEQIIKKLVEYVNSETARKTHKQPSYPPRNSPAPRARHRNVHSFPSQGTVPKSPQYTAPPVKLFVHTELPFTPPVSTIPSSQVQIVEDDEEEEDLDAELESELGELTQSEQTDLRGENVNDIDQ